MEIDLKKIQRRQSIRCMIIAMVDAFNGSIEMKTTHIKRVYNRRIDDVVMFELYNGTTLCLGDMDCEVIDSDLREWQSNHKTEFNIILTTMHR